MPQNSCTLGPPSTTALLPHLVCVAAAVAAAVLVVTALPQAVAVPRQSWIEGGGFQYWERRGMRREVLFFSRRELAACLKSA